MKRIALLLGLLAGASAFAAEQTPMGFLFGLRQGVVSSGELSGDNPLSNGFTGFNVGGQFGIGGSKWIAAGLETGFNVGYTFHGSSSSQYIDRMYMVPILARFDMVLPFGLSITPKVGTGWIRQDWSNGSSQSDFRIMTGLGVGWQFDRSNIAVNWMYSSGGSIDNGPSANSEIPIWTNSVFLSYTYTFATEEVAWWEDKREPVSSMASVTEPVASSSAQQTSSRNAAGNQGRSNGGNNTQTGPRSQQSAATDAVDETGSAGQTEGDGDHARDSSSAASASSGSGAADTRPGYQQPQVLPAISS